MVEAFDAHDTLLLILLGWLITEYLSKNLGKQIMVTRVLYLNSVPG